ncbi:MAG TPA: helix-turn-helix domain-containing protein [Micromonospora sp.]|nr:helix-turn-helix domain-containing protein [Micromonospora sp.]
MVDWADSRGVLHANVARKKFRLARHAPAPELAPFVEHYWVVEYDLRGQPPYQQRVLPHPSVNVTVTGGWSRVAGVIRGHFDETLCDAGRVFGARFRPGGFRPFLDAPVSAVTDRFIPLPEIFGPGALEAADAVLVAAGDSDAAVEMDRLLLLAAPRIDPVVDEVAAIVGLIAADPGLLRVGDLAARLGIGVRRLQRLFAEYVGAGPKWVIRLYRMHEAVQRVEAGGEVGWAALAAQLGFSDQPHFVRDFTNLVGVPPTRYGGDA